jgi:hypothetical protein
VAIQNDVVVILDDEPITRRARLDLDSLSDSAAQMPEEIAGKIFFADGDIFVVENSRVKRAIFNSTQVLYDLQLNADGTFRAQRRNA